MGGWRIIDTLGTKLTTVKPAQGLSAETSTAAAILASSHLGFALSTTQVASGSVLGSGLGRKGADVKWSTAGRIASGWLLTIPAAGIVGAAAAGVAYLGLFGVLLDTAIAIAAVLWIYLSSRQEKQAEISNLDTVGEAVNIRGRKRKLRQDRNRKRAAARREARTEAQTQKDAAKKSRKAQARRGASANGGRNGGAGAGDGGVEARIAAGGGAADGRVTADATVRGEAATDTGPADARSTDSAADSDSEKGDAK